VRELAALPRDILSAIILGMPSVHFAFRTTFEVRWRDLDAMAHVNNAVYFTYLEHARVHYMRHLGLAPDDPTDIRMIMAEASCRYLSPLRLGELVTVHIRVAEMRNSSFTYEYEITGNDGRLAATARTVQVCYDYNEARPARIPPLWREAICQFEPAIEDQASHTPTQETTA
jgi:acyl-CoA thioester hydrolase